MKEKKMISCVILGGALVALITALVAAFAESLTLFIDAVNVQGIDTRDDYQYVAGGITIGGVLLGIVFVAVFFANKKKRILVNAILGGLVVAYSVISLVVLRLLIPLDYYDMMSAGAYALFTSYLTTAITIAVSTALTFAAWLYLTLVKKKETPAKLESETDETKE